MNMNLFHSIILLSVCSCQRVNPINYMLRTSTPAREVHPFMYHTGLTLIHVPHPPDYILSAFSFWAFCGATSGMARACPSTRSVYRSGACARKRRSGKP